MAKRRPTEEEIALKYQRTQAQHLLDLFRATGRPAKTIEELDAWFGSPAGKAALAHDPANTDLDEELLAVCRKAPNDGLAVMALTRVLAYKIVLNVPDAAELPEATEAAFRMLRQAIDLYVKEMVKLGRAMAAPASDSEH